jgi:uncharacterized protein DUF1579
MSTRTAYLSISIPTLLALGALVSQGGEKPQGGEKKEPPKPTQGKGGEMAMPEAPKPTKEHEWLKGLAGTWDLTVQCMGKVEKATETARMFGDFWLMSEVDGTHMGKPFKGHGMLTFDPDKKKFVGTWCESMNPSLMVSEGTSDASGKTLTMEGECKNMEGKVVRIRSVKEIAGPDAMTLTMFEKDKGPTDPNAMKIEYKRRGSLGSAR